MPYTGPVKIRNANVAELISILKRTYEKIAGDIVDATEAGKINKARVMARINYELEKAGVDVDAWIKKELPQYYLDGVSLANAELKKLGVDVTKVGMASINKEAIGYFTDEVSLAFAQSMQGISRSARALLDEALKKQMNFTIADGKLRGDTLKTIAGEVQQRIQDRGIASLVDKSGRSWQLDNYADMLVRTKAVEARNQGLTNVMLNNGYDLVQVSDHNSDHPACHKWEGKILSLTGKTKGYPTLEEAEQDGLFHPRCEHAINVLVPELAAKTEAYDNPYNSMSPEEKSKANAPVGADTL